MQERSLAIFPLADDAAMSNSIARQGLAMLRARGIEANFVSIISGTGVEVPKVSLGRARDFCREYGLLRRSGRATEDYTLVQAVEPDDERHTRAVALLFEAGVEFRQRLLPSGQHGVYVRNESSDAATRLLQQVALPPEGAEPWRSR